jgi:prepilin-type N-terminal cleavage/methylation domain-containing protein
MRTSAAGNRGFTLLELLVTLAVLALVSALAAPAVASRLLDPQPAKSARLVKGLLEEARGAAANAGEPVAVLWLPESRRFALARAGGPEARGADGGGAGARGVAAARASAIGRSGNGAVRARLLEIPPEVEVSARGLARAPGGSWGEGWAEGALFFPGGGSTGGSLTLRAGGSAVSLHLDPLGGNVRYGGPP